MSVFAPLTAHDAERHRQQIAVAANAALRGEISPVGKVSVSAGAASFTIVNEHMGAGKVVFLSPLDAAAAALRWWVDEAATIKGRATIRLVSAPSGACSFNYVILGGKRLGVKGV